MSVKIALTVMKPGKRKALGTVGDAALQEATERVMGCLNGTVILAPDFVRNGDHGHVPGTFGVDEPWPFEPGHKPPR
jgi:hypothetical protein